MTEVAVPPPCSRCGSLRIDEYTHYGCPDDSTGHARRHWTCAMCEFEFVTTPDA
jgi:hypothetical protein